jgi:hypothetical protein
VLLEAMHAARRVFRTKESRDEDGSQKKHYELTVSQMLELVL